MEDSSCMELFSNELKSGVLNKRDMQNMQSGGTLGLELRTTDLDNPLRNNKKKGNCNFSSQF